MKTNRKNKLVLTVFLLSIVTLYSFKVIQTNNLQTKNKIIGNWVSEKDTKWKIEFTDTNNCNWYYDNSITDTFTYTVNNSSCKNELDIEYEYLKLNNSSKAFCYSINGITEENGVEYLSIEWNSNPKPMIFIKK